VKYPNLGFNWPLMAATLSLLPTANAMTSLASAASPLRYPRITLPEMLNETARKFPRRTALIYFGSRITYGQLLDHVRRCAAGLQARGVKKGDRVALMLPNCPQFVIAYFGAMQAGAVVTATSPIYTAREAGHQWADSGAETVIVDRRMHPVVEAAHPHLPQLKNVVVSGFRDYYPRNFSRLCRILPKRKSGSQQSAKLTSKSSMTWQDLLSIRRTPHSVALRPADIACLQYTGGTTGVSKGAILTHANLVINAHQTCQWLSSGKEGAEVMMGSLPFFHIYAMTCVMISAVMTGGTVIILPRFELRAALNAIRKYRPTVFHGVPTMYVAFNALPKLKGSDFKSLRVCMSGGAPLPVEVQEKFERLSGARLVEGYGLTEASPVTHVNPPDGLSKVGSIGLLIPGTEARIMDLETGTREMPDGEIGEIVIRGPQVMKGYWHKPEETAKVLRNGWLYTGDIARRDADGYFSIVDRKKDLIIAGGFNIYPRDVEEILFEHPKVQEAVVIGVPDEYRGETVKAFVVLKDGATTTPKEIIAFCRERLAAYKVPREIEFRDSLPKSGAGKYLRRELRHLSAISGARRADSQASEKEPQPELPP
jgi:long-chain acyl-CoA synthetase